MFKIRILCLPIQIKAKYYPFVLILFFSVLVGIRYDLLIAVFVGMIDHKFFSERIYIRKDFLITLETSDILSLLKLSPCKRKLLIK